MESHLAAFAMGLQHVAASSKTTQRLVKHAVPLALSIKPFFPWSTQNVVGSAIVEHAAGSTGGGTHVCCSSAGHATPPPDAGDVTPGERVFFRVVWSQADQEFHTYTQSTIQQISCSEPPTGQVLPPLLG